MAVPIDATHYIVGIPFLDRENRMQLAKASVRALDDDGVLEVFWEALLHRNLLKQIFYTEHKRQAAWSFNILLGSISVAMLVLYGTQILVVMGLVPVGALTNTLVLISGGCASNVFSWRLFCNTANRYERLAASNYELLMPNGKQNNISPTVSGEASPTSPATTASTPSSSNNVRDRRKSGR